jgi:multiple antibiotic resistance protein
MIEPGMLISVWVRFFFLFTPFFALSMFLGLTRGFTPGQRLRLTLSICLAVLIFCLVLYFFGTHVFALFGITLDAFRVGAGALLFLSAVRLISPSGAAPAPDSNQDIAVVPLAMPVIVGPATVGALMVMGAETTEAAQKLQGSLSLVLAVISVGVLLASGAFLEKVLGRKGIQILSRITALVLAALAAQMMLTGVKSFLLTP